MDGLVTVATGCGQGASSASSPTAKGPAERTKSPGAVCRAGALRSVCAFVRSDVARLLGFNPKPAAPNTSARQAAVKKTSAAPNGPSALRAMSRKVVDSKWPPAPPSPALVGQATSRGSMEDAVAKAGIASPTANRRNAGWPSPRPRTSRHAQASIASAGNAPATPKPCSRKSARTEPTGPKRLVACCDVAVFSDGSRGL